MNIKPDIIIIWPTYFDFPGFRLQLQRDRQYFNRVIIGFNYDNYNDFLSTEIVPFIQREMKADPNAVCISPDEVNNYPSADWATRSICSCLKYVESEWVLLLQQDFIVYNPLFWSTILTDKYDIVGRRERPNTPHLIHIEGCKCPGEGDILDRRWEPDFILIRTSIIKDSRVDFAPGPHPITGVGMDSVGPWSIDIQKRFSNSSTLHTLGFHIPNDFEHFRGFVEGHRYLQNNILNMIIHRPRFKKYHQDILKEIHKINVHPLTMDLVKKAASLKI